jgi:hypothetical protein
VAADAEVGVGAKLLLRSFARARSLALARVLFSSPPLRTDPIKRRVSSHTWSQMRTAPVTSPELIGLCVSCRVVTCVCVCVRVVW